MRRHYVRRILCFLLVVLIFFFDIGNHTYSYRVTAALEISAEECVEDINSKRGADYSCAHADYVCIVVHSRHSCREGVGAERRSYSVIFVCAHGHSYTGAADEKTESLVGRLLNLAAYR